ncbi:mucin-2-like isoform X2 [Ostrea edulis]|uniref:mucin-2-like isoform X2 n=1 Tax=Ostrea edulis TaxID=37623 RepID=UPI0024AFAB57|nr:mucin-2-like isoform X2 [Ostrea edulis]
MYLMKTILTLVGSLGKNCNINTDHISMIDSILFNVPLENITHIPMEKEIIDTILSIIDFLGYGSTRDVFMGYLDEKSGQITSPDFPATYPNNVNCTWLIRTGHPQSNVTITVIDMDIKEWNPCDDYLKIQEVDPCCFTVFKRCGAMQSEKRMARGSKIEISFVSDHTLTAKGFRLSWTVISPPPPTKRIMSSTLKILTSSRMQKTTTLSTGRTTISTSKLATPTTTTSKTTTTATTTTPTTTTTTTPTTTTSKTTTTTTPTLTIPSTTSTTATTTTPTTTTTTTPTTSTTTTPATTKTTTSNTTMTTTPAITSKAEKTKITRTTKIPVSRTISQVTTAINASGNVLLVTQVFNDTIINSSTAVSVEEQSVSFIIGICVAEVILVTAGICVMKRLQASSSDKTSPPPDIDQNVSNHYHSIPLENFSTSEFKVAEEGVYVDRPDNVYDSTFASRPHNNQDNFNVYQTCEKTYDTTFSRR